MRAEWEGQSPTEARGRAWQRDLPARSDWSSDRSLSRCLLAEVAAEEVLNYSKNFQRCRARMSALKAPQTPFDTLPPLVEQKIEAFCGNHSFIHSSDCVGC